MGIVDKNSIGIGGRQFHIGVAPGEVSTIALMPGDPFRVPLVAGYMRQRSCSRAVSRRDPSDPMQ